MISMQSGMSSTFELEDSQVIEQFVDGSDQLLASRNLRLEVTANLAQLTSQSGEPVAIMYHQNEPRNVMVKNGSLFAKSLDSSLIDRNFVLIGGSRPGFSEYKQYPVPVGYTLYYTEPSTFWKKWWRTEKIQSKQQLNLNILVRLKDNWYPILDINLHGGAFTIKTIAGQIVSKENTKVLWLNKIDQSLTATPAPEIQSSEPTRQLSGNLAQKIHQRKSEIKSEQAWAAIKILEDKLQVQITLYDEMVVKCDRAEHRAKIAEEKLRIAHKYLNKIGAKPQDVYRESKSDHQLREDVIN